MSLLHLSASSVSVLVSFVGAKTANNRLQRWGVQDTVSLSSGAKVHLYDAQACLYNHIVHLSSELPDKEAHVQSTSSYNTRERKGGMQLRLGLYHALARVRFKPHCISVPITVKLLSMRSQNSVLRDLFAITPRRHQPLSF